MTSFFFYGTLLDHDVMAVVIGRRLPPSAFVAGEPKATRATPRQGRELSDPAARSRR
jgi:hypothetical protein